MSETSLPVSAETLASLWQQAFDARKAGHLRFPTGTKDGTPEREALVAGYRAAMMVATVPVNPYDGEPVTDGRN